MFHGKCSACTLRYQRKAFPGAQSACTAFTALRFVSSLCPWRTRAHPAGVQSSQKSACPENGSPGLRCEGAPMCIILWMIVVFFLCLSSPRWLQKGLLPIFKNTKNNTKKIRKKYNPKIQNQNCRVWKIQMVGFVFFLQFVS